MLIHLKPLAEAVMALTVLSLNPENDILAGTSVHYYVHSLNVLYLVMKVNRGWRDQSSLAASLF
jgi:hypothetical protein